MDDRTLSAIRFGTGLPLSDGALVGAGPILAGLRAPDLAAQALPVPGVPAILPLLQKVQAARAAARAEGGTRDAYKAALKEAVDLHHAATRTIFARAVGSPDGFRERLAAFWTDHFTTKARTRAESILQTAFVDDAIRPHLTGRFADLLTAAVLHPAMLVYLDQVASIGPGSAVGIKRGKGINENLAREVMELHTLGVGAAYGQEDVRQMALLLTGLDATAKDGFVFRANRAEPGAEVVLGRSYGGDGVEPVRAVLHDLALRPETAAHLARKLAVHFVADAPDPGMVGAMTQAYTDTGGELQAVYAAMLAHPAAWEPSLQKARQPFDFLVASMRALGVSGEEVARFGKGQFNRLILVPMALMGQKWQDPVGPDGWAEEAEAWITPQGLAARIAWAMEVPGRLVPQMPDPRAFSARALGGAADERLVWAVERAESVREGVGLVLASPAFNRR